MKIKIGSIYTYYNKHATNPVFVKHFHKLVKVIKVTQYSVGFEFIDHVDSQILPIYFTSKKNLRPPNNTLRFLKRVDKDA